MDIETKRALMEQTMSDTYYAHKDKYPDLYDRRYAHNERISECDCACAMLYKHAKGFIYKNGWPTYA